MRQMAPELCGIAQRTFDGKPGATYNDPMKSTARPQKTSHGPAVVPA